MFHPVLKVTCQCSIYSNSGEFFPLQCLNNEGHSIFASISFLAVTSFLSTAITWARTSISFLLINFFYITCMCTVYGWCLMPPEAAVIDGLNNHVGAGNWIWVFCHASLFLTHSPTLHCLHLFKITFYSHSFCVRVPVCMWRSKDNLLELVFPSIM